MNHLNDVDAFALDIIINKSCWIDKKVMRLPEELYTTIDRRVRAHLHCTICDCDLFLLTMGCIGASKVATVAECEHFH